MGKSYSKLFNKIGNHYDISRMRVGESQRAGSDDKSFHYARGNIQSTFMQLLFSFDQGHES